MSLTSILSGTERANWSETSARVIGSFLYSMVMSSLLLLDSFLPKCAQLKMRTPECLSSFFGIWRNVPGDLVPGRIRLVLKWKTFRKIPPSRMYHSRDKEESVDPVLRHKCGNEVPPGTDLLSLSRTVWIPHSVYEFGYSCTLHRAN